MNEPFAVLDALTCEQAYGGSRFIGWIAWQLPDKNNLRAARAWTTTPTEGSRIRDLPPADSEAVYRPAVEKTCPAAAPFRCGRFYGSFAPRRAEYSSRPRASRLSERHT
jgi:hypothetical protein